MQKKKFTDRYFRELNNFYDFTWTQLLKIRIFKERPVLTRRPFSHLSLSLFYKLNLVVLHVFGTLTPGLVIVFSWRGYHLFLLVKHKAPNWLMRSRLII